MYTLYYLLIYKKLYFVRTSRHRLQTAERNAKDGRPRWVFDFLDISVSDAVQPSEKFDGWPGRRPSRLRWLKEIQMTLFGWR